MVDYKVTVCCVTYNHKNFIAQALESIVAQKVNFPFQLLVGDDASIDGTTDIVREYANKYPDIIKPIFHKEHIGAFRNSLSLYQSAKTKYVAICDGDDYWTDENKLQRQVDFLDTHPDYSICFHSVLVTNEDNHQPDKIFPSNGLLKELGDMSLSSLLRCNFMQTNSVVYRWRFADEDILSYYQQEVSPGDWFLLLLHARVGKIGFLSDVMAVYRRHRDGIWSVENADLFYKNNGLPHLKFICKVKEQFGYFNEGDFYNFFQNTIVSFFESKDFERLRQLSEEFPEGYSRTIENISADLEKGHHFSKRKNLFG